MKVDHETLQDLAIFHNQEEQSVFNTLNFTSTAGGADWLRHLLSQPHNQKQPIEETQQLLQLIGQHLPDWPSRITNGTIMVLERYYNSQIDKIPAQPNITDALLYKVLHGHDYSLIKYTVGHAIDFLKGMHQMVALFDGSQPPRLLQTMLEQIQLILGHEKVVKMIGTPEGKKLAGSTLLDYGRFLLLHFKGKLLTLIELHSRLDAYVSLAKAIRFHGLRFPVFKDINEPFVQASGLRHILLKHPVSYQISFSQHSNFLFLTGANMAGKSTFIKAMGIALYLAHIGMAVPAHSMELSLFDGIISNIQVSDNIIKGESYFFNEVQRVRNTLLRISDGQKWLVLIDELFKGTNVQDAMRCSSTVIKGLLKINRSLFILSTHLYEIGDELKGFPNITFKYFETTVANDDLYFSYQLKDGISNDRLGYLILKREGVVEMIEKL
jgi:DNA mismatch repair ATPase MutS